MQKVFARMMANQYHGIEDMVSDLVLMFDNACRYNEPESLIYKVVAYVDINTGNLIFIDAYMWNSATWCSGWFGGMFGL